MKNAHYLVTVLSLISLNAFGGEINKPQYLFHAIAKPGARIGGHTFSKDTSIDSFAISESGECAFLANWKHGRGAVFTSKRLIAKNGDKFDGITLRVIESHSDLKVNERGQVAYEGKFTFDLDKSGRLYWGIFVDRHLVVSGRRSDFAPAYDFHEDGTIYLSDKTESFVSQSAELLSAWRPGHRPELADDPGPFSTATNFRGQKLISFTFRPSSFLLLLGTPITH